MLNNFMQDIPDETGSVAPGFNLPMSYLNEYGDEIMPGLTNN